MCKTNIRNNIYVIIMLLHVISLSVISELLVVSR